MIKFLTRRCWSYPRWEQKLVTSAVQTAMMYDIPLQVRSTFTDRKGTTIFDQQNIDYTKSVTGVAYSKDDAKITLIGVEDRPGVAANIFEPLIKLKLTLIW